MKDCGSFVPSTSVIDVCQETEKTFQRMIVTIGGELPQAKGIADAITFSVLQNLDLRKIFRSLDDHMFDCAVEDNHVLALIKTITKCYCKGSDYTISMDGHDKLCGFHKSMFPLCIYGGQDTYGGRINFLHVWTTNNDPLLIGRYCLDYLYQNRVVNKRKETKKALPTGIPEHNSPERYGGKKCGIPLNDDDLKEVADVSGVLDYPEDYLDPLFRESCQSFIENVDDIKPDEAAHAFMYLKTNLSQETIESHSS
eukprot:gene10334-11409_t